MDIDDVVGRNLRIARAIADANHDIAIVGADADEVAHVRQIVAGIAHAVGLETEDFGSVAASWICGASPPPWFRRWRDAPRPTAFVIGDLEKEGFTDLLAVVNHLRAHANGDARATVVVVTSRNRDKVAIALGHRFDVDTRDIPKA